MGRLEKEIFVCVDCEFTGLDPIQDRIVEVAVVVFTLEQILETYETLVDPEMNIPETSMKIHHITDEMVKGKPKIHEVLPDIFKMIGRKTIIGHSILFDRDMLEQAAKRASLPCTLSNNLFIDTLRLARSYGDCPINSLEQLRRHFNVEFEGAHRAMGDVIVNIEVFKHLLRRFKTTEQVFALLSKPIKMEVMPLGKHKGRSLKEIPLDYLIWASKKEFDQDLIFSLRDEIKKRKQGNLFQNASNPFQNL